MKNALKNLESHLCYEFHDKTLLTQALTHRSKQKKAHNERLEFLGDSVLSLVISTALFAKYPDAAEGVLSRLRAALVKGETIATLARALGVAEHLQLGAGELKSGGQFRESILAGCFEAIIGAVYLDGGFQTAQASVLRWYGDLLENIDNVTDVKDAKTELQEWLQARHMPLPSYDCVVVGEAHAQIFEVTCRVDGLSQEAQGKSSTRRKAEQIAAKLFLNKLG